MTGSTQAVRRELSVAVGLCLLASSGALLAAGRTWATGTVAALPPLPARELALTGSQSGAPVRGLAVLGLAGGVAVLAARGWLRVTVGILLLLAGVIITVAGAGFDAGEALGAERIDPAATARTAWPLLAACCGAGLILAGLLVAVRGRGWSGMSRRYETPSAPTEAARPPLPEAGRPAERELWEALDRGEDPTAPAPAGEPPPPPG